MLATILIAALVFFFVVVRSDNYDKSTEVIIGSVIGVILITIMVDGHFMSQMRTAVEATDASLSYTSEGLVVTDRWRSTFRTSSKRKARKQALGE